MWRRSHRLVILHSIVVGIAFFWTANADAQQPSDPDAATRRVYVPFQDLETLFERDQRGVILPRAEFQKLAEAARRNAGDAESIRRHVAISKATYSARFPDDQLVLSAEIEFTQLHPGVFSIPLPFEGLAVESATVDGKPASLGRTPAVTPQPVPAASPAATAQKPASERRLVLFTSQPGKHLLKLELSAGLVSVGSDRVATFNVPAIPAAVLNATVGAGKFLHVNELALDRQAAADQPANYSTAIGGVQRVALRITDQQARQDAATLTFAGTAIGIHVAPEERTWRAVTTLNVYGKPIDSLEFRIPKTLDIVSVESTGLERWEIAPGAGESDTTLKLFYRQAFNETRTVTLQGIGSSVIGRPWSVPTLKLAGATTHTVRVLVQHLPTLRLQLVEATNARRVSASELPTSDMPDMTAVAAANRLHFTAWREDFSLMFVTQPRERELQAGITTRIDVGSRELELVTSVGISTRFAPLFEVDLTLPAEWTIDEVRHAGQPVLWRLIPVEAGMHQVRVTFDAPVPTGGKADLTLTARMIPGENWPIESGQDVQILLPEVFLPEVGVTEGRYMIAAEEALDIAAEELSGLEPARASAAELSAPRPPRLIYEYQDTRFTGNLKISRKPPRLAVQTFAFHRLDRETVNSHLEVLVHIAGGGVRELRLSLPESTGTGFRFQLLRGDVRVTEQTASEPANGQRVWTLKFDQRTFGLMAIAADLETPRAKDAANFVMPALRIDAAERQSGYVAIEAASDQQVQVKAADAGGQPLSDVDPVDLPLALAYAPRERIIAAFRSIQPGYQLTLSDHRFDREAVPTAICDRATLATILGDSGERQHEASYSLRAVGVQSLHVQLPHSAILWATVLDGRPIEVRRASEGSDGTIYLVPLSNSSQPETARSLQLFYRTTRDEFRGSGSIRQSPPRLSAMTGQGSLQPVEVLQQEWKVHLPRQIEITSSTGEFEPIEKPQRTSYLGILQSRISLDSPSVLLWKLLPVAIAIAVLYVLRYAVRQRGTRGFAVVLLGGILIVFIAALMLPTFSSIQRRAHPVTSDAESAWNYESRAFVSGGDAMPQSKTEATVEGKPDDFASFMPAPMASPAEQAAGPTAVDGLAGLHREANDPFSKETVRAEDKARAAPRSPDRFTDESKTLMDGIAGQIADQRANTPAAGPVNAPAAAQPTQPPQSGFIGGGIAETAPPAGAALPGPATPPIAKPTAKGLLSLAVNLQPPAGSRTAVFQYFGAPRPEVEPELALSYQNHEAFSFVTIAWQAALVLVFWFLRHSSVSLRGAVAVFGLAIPLALVPLVPLDLLPHLDGIFLGTVWGLVLWALIALVHRVHCPLCAILPGLKQNGAAAAVLISAVILARCFTNAPVNAQEKPPAAPTQSLPASARRVVPPPPHSIILPYDLTEDARKSARVYLPFDEFLKLWNAANPDKRVEEPPVEAVVAEALYAAELQSSDAPKTARLDVTARFVLHSFVRRQVTVALPLGPVALTSGQLDGKSAPIISRESDNVHELAVLLDRPGVHVLDVRFAMPVELTGPVGKVTLPLKPVSSGTLRFVLPAEDRVLRVNGGGIFRKMKENDRTIAVIPVDRASDVTLSWSPARTQDAAQQGSIQAETNTAVLVEDTGLALHASVVLQTRQGTLSELSFSLPDGLLVRNITGPDVGGWEISGTGAARTLKVFLRRAVTDNTRLGFDIFQSRSFTDDGSASTVPPFAPQGVARETGTIGVHVERQLSASVVTATGLTQIDNSQYVAPAVTTDSGSDTGAKRPIGTVPPQVAYRYTRRPFELSLLVSRQKPQARVVSEHAFFIGAHKVQAGSRFELTLTGAPRSQLTVQLPFGFLLNDLKSRDAADYFVETPNPEQGSLLHIDLAEPRTGQLEFIVEGIMPRDPEDLAPQLGVPALIGINEQRAVTAIWLDRNYSATVQESAGWRGTDPQQIPPQLRAAHASSIQFAFTSTLTALQPITVTLNRAVPRLSADALTVVIVRDTAVEYALHLRWRISQARENRFSFTTPDWLEGRLDFTAAPQAPRVRQVLTEKLGAGKVRWTVVLDDYQSDRYFALARAVLPPPKEGRVDAPQMVFEQSEGTLEESAYQPLETQSTHLLLINQSSATLAPIDAGAVATEPVDELPIKVTRNLSDQAAEIVKVRDARAVIGWIGQTRRQSKSLSATVNLAKMSLVVVRDGSWRELAEFRVQNRGRQFLALQMPKESHVLSLFVAGQPARPVKAQRNSRDLLLVPLPKTSAADLSAEVKLVCTGRLPKTLPRGVQVFRTEFELPAPQVVSTTDDAEFGMPVAATEWTVYLPEDIDVKRVDDPDRTNVAQSVEGYEQLLAEIRDAVEVANYMVEGASLGSRKNLSFNMRGLALAKNNLKQIDFAIGNQRSAVLSNALSQEQQLEISANLGELEKLKQQIQRQDAEMPAVDGAAVLPQQLDVGAVQREIIGSNRGDFVTKDADKDEGEIRLELQKAVEESVSGKAPDDAWKKSGGKAQLKRQELREQNFFQSANINAEVAKQQAAQQPQRRGSQIAGEDDVNANDVLGDMTQHLRDYGREIAQLKIPGGGGGFGGSGSERFAPSPEFRIETAVPGWTNTTGLSLDINIPQNGQKLTFSKSGGDARLAVGLRPRASMEAGFNLIWTGVWVAVAIGVAAAFARQNATACLSQQFPLLFIAVGLIWYLLLPVQFAGFALFMTGGLIFCWQRRRGAKAV